VGKSVVDLLSDSDRLHDLSVKFRKQKDTSSADKLDAKVRAMRGRAIAKMGKKPKIGNTGRLPGVRPDSSIPVN